MMTAVLQAPESPAQLMSISVGVNLLPDEIVDARRGRKMRAYVALGLVVVVALLGGWYFYAHSQVGSAQSTLNATQDRTNALQSQQRAFSSLVTTQARSARLETELAALTKGDLSWTAMLAAVQKAAPAGIVFSGLNGTVAQTTGTASSTAAVSNGGLPVTGTQVGTLVVTGNAADQRTLAAFVDALTKVRGLSTPIPTSAATVTGKLGFTVDASITDVALGSRFSPTKGSK